MNFTSISLFFTSSHWLLATVFGFLVFWYFLKKKNNNLPPGPPCLPLIGNLHLMGSEIHTTLYNLSKKYGDIYRLYLGQQLLIIVSGKRLFSQILTTQSAHFSKRPEDFFLGKYLSRGKNFVFSGEMSVDEHKKQKSIAMAALKKTEKTFSTHIPRNDFEQVDKSELQSCIEAVFCEEVLVLSRQLVKLGEEYDEKYRFKPKGKQEYTVAVMKLTLTSSIRSIYTLLFGKRYDIYV